MVKETQTGETEKSETRSGGSRRNLLGPDCGVSNTTVRRDSSSQETSYLMEAVVERENKLSGVFHLAAWSNIGVSMYFMNRRIRNRMYGGVGGRRA